MHRFSLCWQCGYFCAISRLIYTLLLQCRVFSLWHRRERPKHQRIWQKIYAFLQHTIEFFDGNCYHFSVCCLLLLLYFSLLLIWLATYTVVNGSANGNGNFSNSLEMLAQTTTTQNPFHQVKKSSVNFIFHVNQV